MGLSPSVNLLSALVCGKTNSLTTPIRQCVSDAYTYSCVSLDRYIHCIQMLSASKIYVHQHYFSENALNSTSTIHVEYCLF